MDLFLPGSVGQSQVGGVGQEGVSMLEAPGSYGEGMGEPLSEPMTGKTKIRTKNKNLISDNRPPSEFDVLAACLHRCCLAAFVFLYSGFYNDVLSFNKGEVK